MTALGEKAVALAQSLIRCESVTPRDAGAIEVLVQALKPARFTCEKLTFSEGGGQPIENLYARVGDSPPHLCFAGHTDVVPVGRREALAASAICRQPAWRGAVR